MHLVIKVGDKSGRFLEAKCGYLRPTEASGLGPAIVLPFLLLFEVFRAEARIEHS